MEDNVFTDVVGSYYYKLNASSHSLSYLVYVILSLDPNHKIKNYPTREPKELLGAYATPY